MRKRLKVQVDRSRWLRGREHNVLLHVKSHHMCCMGFGCLAAGYTAQEIVNQSAVEDVRLERDPEARDEVLEEFEGGNAERSQTKGTDPRRSNGDGVTQVPADQEPPISELIYAVNDDERLSDADREGHLITLGRQIGIDFEFHGESLPKHTEHHQARSWDEIATGVGVETPVAEMVTTFRAKDPESGAWRLVETMSGDAGDEGTRTLQELAKVASERLNHWGRETDQAVRMDIATRDGAIVASTYREPSDGAPISTID